MEWVTTGGRARRWAALLTVVVAVLAAQPTSAPASGVSQVAVRVGQSILTVPPSFLGVSVEQNELLRYDRHRPAFLRLLRALDPPGDNSPMTLRIGGESADSSFWGPNPFAMVKPAYRQDHPYVLTPAWLAEAGSLVAAGALRVIFDLNLAAHSPSMARAVATGAWRAFPSQSITSFEIGNELDLYRAGLVGLTQAVRGGRNTWAFDFGVDDYVKLCGDYTRSLQRALPAARFAGPAGANRSTTWVRALGVGSARRRLALVTEHYYPPFAGCVAAGSRKNPSATGYLQDGVAAGFAAGERPMVSAGHALGLPVRLTDTVSSVCGGVAGQTDTFATALWAPDILFNLLAARIDGVNIHLRANYFVNTALLYTRSGLYAEPLFYGLLLFARALGPGAQLMQPIRTGGPGTLKVWIVHLRDGGLRAMYINKSSQPAYVNLAAGGSGTALVDRLSGPSITANHSVTFDGQRFTPDGGWVHPPSASILRGSTGTYRLLVSRYSAALVSVPGRS